MLIQCLTTALTWKSLVKCFNAIKENSNKTNDLISFICQLFDSIELFFVSDWLKVLIYFHS